MTSAHHSSPRGQPGAESGCPKESCNNNFPILDRPDLACPVGLNGIYSCLTSKTYTLMMRLSKFRCEWRMSLVSTMKVKTH